MYGGQATSWYVNSVMELQRHCHDHDIGFAWQFLTSESLITRGRNSLAAAFMASDCTHHVSIDADIEFVPKDVMRLVNSGHDFTCGLYPMKIIDWPHVRDNIQQGMDLQQVTQDTSPSICNFIDNAHAGMNPRPVSRCGTGFMCVTRRVFEVLENRVPTYRGNRPGEMQTIYHEFFATAIDSKTQTLLSEDYYFCDLWRAAGGEIWAYQDIDLNHVGLHVFKNRTKYLMPPP